MVNRNAGAGTRVLIDRLLDGRAARRLQQPAALAQRGRRRGGAGPGGLGHRDRAGRRLYGLGFLPIAPEDYDFLLVESRRDRPAVQAFLAALRDETVREKIRALGMRPADA